MSWKSIYRAIKSWMQTMSPPAFSINLNHSVCSVDESVVFLDILIAEIVGAKRDPSPGIAAG
jgi:hypothetical protein